MQVRLISHTENPDELCSRIAKMCYSSSKFEDIKPDVNLLKNIVKSGHMSVIEHATFTFAIEGISRVTSHQLVRHRMASYTQQSQRYTRLEKTVCKLPSSIEAVVDGDKEASELFDKLNEDLDHFIDMLREFGVSEEDIRYFFFNATETNIVVTMNARELLHFFDLRCCMRAQWEIRELAEKMLDECKKVAPAIFVDAGAPCEHGACLEGARSCKRGVENGNKE